MGLWSNLRVLCASDIGDRVRELTRKVAQLQAELDDQADLCESRYRRFNKRARDDGKVARDGQPAGSANPLVARVYARRAARGLGGHVGMGNQ